MNSEHCFEVLFEQMAQGVIFQNADGTIALINPAAREILSVSEDQLHDIKTIDDNLKFIHEDGSPFPAKEHPTITSLKTGLPVKDELMGVYVPASQTYRWILINTVPLFKPGSTKPYQAFVTFDDISERIRGEQERRQGEQRRKHGEALLRNSEERFRTLSNLVPVGIYLTTPEGQCLYANPVWLEMAGLTLEQTLGTGWIQGLHPEDRKTVFANWQKMTASNGQWGCEYRFQTPDGKVTWVYGLAAPQKDTDGKITAYVGANIDITDRKQAEQAIIENESKYHSLFTGMTEGVALHEIVYSAEGEPINYRIIDVNPAFEIQTGLKISEVKGRIATEAYKTDAPPYFKEYEKVARTGNPLSFEAYFQPMDKHFYISVHSSKPGNFVTAFTDITDRKKAEENLQENEQKYRLLHEAAGVGVGYYSPDGKIISYNRLAAENMGGTVEDFIGKSIWDIFHKVEADFYFDRIKLAIQSTKPQEYDDEVDLPSGCKWFHSVFTKIMDSNGKVLGIQIISSDITERKLVETQLQESQHQYRILIENANEAIVVAQAGKIVFINHVTQEILTGYSEREIKEKPFLDFVHPDDRVMVGQNYQKRIKGEKAPSKYEFRVVTKDGVIKWVEINAVLLEWQGKPATLNFLTDITERWTADHELGESEKRYRSLYEESPLAYQSLDADGRFLEANPTWLNNMGYSREEVIGRWFGDFLDPSQVELFKERFPLFKNRGKVTTELNVLRKDGSYVTMQFNGRVGYSSDGLFKQTHCILADITERKKAEQEIIANEKRLEILIKILEYKTDSIQALLDYALEQAILLTQSKYGYIYFYDDSKKEFTLNTWSKDVMDQCSVQSPQSIYELEKTGIWGEVVRQNKPIMVNDFQSPNPLKKGYPKGHVELNRYLSIPVHEGDKIVAVVGVANKETDYTNTDLYQLSLLMESVWKSTESIRTANSLRQAAREWRTTFDSIADMVAIVDTKHKVLRVNQAFSETLGKKPQELIGKPCYEVIHGMNQPHPMCPHALTLTTKKVESSEYFDKKLKVWVEATSSPIFDDNGQLTGSVHIIKDISERKRIEKEVIDNEERFRTIFQESPISMIIHDKDSGEIVDANRTAYLSYGYSSPNEFKNSNIWMEAPYSEKEALALIHKAVTQGMQSCEWKNRKLTGDVFWEKVTLMPLTINGIERILATSIDITKVKQATEALQESEERFRSMVNSMEETIFTLDKEMRHTGVFGPWVAKAGLTSEYFLGKTARDLFGEAAATIHEEANRKALDGEFVIYEWNTTGESGTQYFQTSLSPIRKKGNNIVGLVGIGRDITKQKIAEAEQLKLRDKAEASSRLAAVGEMAAGIAHEINNPLTGVIGFSELLKDREDLPDDVIENLGIINDGSVRVKEIIRRMLTFARQSKPEKTLTSITELIENTLELRSYVLSTSNIVVVRDYARDLPWVTVDPGQLQQVFLNLIVNAEYAMKQAYGKGMLTIKTEKLDGYIRVSVTDDGSGMSEETKTKLFQPFFTTKEVGEGTGLGLSLSFGIIQEHGGTIRVESELGHGTTFIIELPITASEDESEIKVSVIEQTSSNVTPANILVVDDELTIRSLIKSILGKRGHTVAETDSPHRALEMIGKTNYDLIFMDVRMPGMSGMELHQKISDQWPEQANRVVFITGDTSDLITRAYLDKHQIPYITKPFERLTLEEKGNEILGRNQS